MTFDYTQLALVAQRMITRFGRSTTLRTNVKTGDEWNPTITPSDATINAVFISFKATDVDNTLIKSGDKMLLSYTQIDSKNIIIDGGVKYEVVGVEEVKTGDTAILYKAHIRT